MRLDLTLLGIGAAFDAPRGVANTGALLELRESNDGRGEVPWRFLIDCGHTCSRQLARLGFEFGDIDGVLLTHTHGDHMDGLELCGFDARFKRDTRMMLMAHPSVLELAWSALRPKMGWTVASDALDLDGYFEPVAAGPDRLLLGDGSLTARFFPVPHLPGFPAYGLAIEVGMGGPVIRWSGDTTFDPDNPIFADLDPDRGDRIFHECTFEPPGGDRAHTHFEELTRLPGHVRRCVVLVHHGRIERPANDYDGMVLGQPFQTFRFPAERRLRLVSSGGGS